MKRIIVIIIGWLAVSGLQAQLVETMRVYTDKECYLAGEDLWIKVCVTDSLSAASVPSKVAYVEIGDTKQVYAQGKIDLQDGNGWGRIRLPQTMHTGAYQLVAYTRYMRNRPASCFPKKYIALLNTIQTTEEDDMELINDSLSTVSATQSSSSMRLLTDKPMYGNRSKVTLALPDLPAGARELTLSVVRKDCILSGFASSAEDIEDVSHAPLQRYIAECEGHIVMGRLAEKSANPVNVRLSCVGKDIRVFDGRPQSDDIYAFYTTEITDIQDIVVTTSSQKEGSYRLEFISPFAGVLPKSLPKLRLSFNEDALIERSFGAQLRPILPVDSVHRQGILEQLHGFVPVSTYNLDEYVRFKTVREALIEFILGIRVSKVGGKTSIRILQPDLKQFSTQRAMVLLDGVPIDNHENILDYDARLIHYVHRYAGKYTFGGELYDGIISFITHKGTLPDMRLDDNSQLFSYEFPQKQPAFTAPEYQSQEQVNSRIPDLRHTLYWKPDVNPSTNTVTFYTSDMNGTYTVTLQGITADGKELKMQTEFVVEAPR